VDVSADESLADIVADGFDAGLRLGASQRTSPCHGKPKRRRLQPEYGVAFRLSGAIFGSHLFAPIRPRRPAQSSVFAEPPDHRAGLPFLKVFFL
jgi:hypothetical protein